MVVADQNPPDDKAKDLVEAAATAVVDAGGFEEGLAEGVVG